MIRRFARPYARALMDVAGSPQAANAVRGELMRFEAAMTMSAELRALYGNPGITSDQKMAIAQQLAKKMKLGELSVKFLEVLVRSNRINDLGAILEGIHHAVNEAMGVAIAEVRSARTLLPDEMQDLARVLGEKTGKTVELDIKTDPSLLGGFVAKVGSAIFDASVSGKISKFRDSLT
ncbi:MAG: ATP synthase F1 subunit delta [Thermoanaerobaculia bacterium]|nr:ATP synthase F1 subunit delta [Thermoanaerobaculia bacterium]